MLDVGLADEIKMAARRANATGADLKAFTVGDTFARILPVLRGLGEVVMAKRLRHVGAVSFPALRKNHDPREFFQNRDGLYVWNDFRNQILPVASPMKKRTPKAKISIFDLTVAMTDEEIETELGDAHIFEDTGIACAYLKEMLTRQKSGEEGDLLVNGYANILYVRGVNSEVFAVHVHWDAASRGWHVHAFRLDDCHWCAGDRVLSATAGA